MVRAIHRGFRPFVTHLLVATFTLNSLLASVALAQDPPATKDPITTAPAARVLMPPTTTDPMPMPAAPTPPATPAPADPAATTVPAIRPARPKPGTLSAGREAHTPVNKAIAGEKGERGGSGATSALGYMFKTWELPLYAAALGVSGTIWKLLDARTRSVNDFIRQGEQLRNLRTELFHLGGGARWELSAKQLELLPKVDDLTAKEAQALALPKGAIQRTLSDGTKALLIQLPDGTLNGFDMNKFVRPTSATAREFQEAMKLMRVGKGQLIQAFRSIGEEQFGGVKDTLKANLSDDVVAQVERLNHKVPPAPRKVSPDAIRGLQIFEEGYERFYQWAQSLAGTPDAPGRLREILKTEPILPAHPYALRADVLNAAGQLESTIFSQAKANAEVEKFMANLTQIEKKSLARTKLLKPGWSDKFWLGRNAKWLLNGGLSRLHRLRTPILISIAAGSVTLIHYSYHSQDGALTEANNINNLLDATPAIAEQLNIAFDQHTLTLMIESQWKRAQREIPSFKNYPSPRDIVVAQHATIPSAEAKEEETKEEAHPETPAASDGETQTDEKEKKAEKLSPITTKEEEQIPEVDPIDAALDARITAEITPEEAYQTLVAQWWAEVELLVREKHLALFDLSDPKSPKLSAQVCKELWPIIFKWVHEQTAHNGGFHSLTDKEVLDDHGEIIKPGRADLLDTLVSQTPHAYRRIVAEWQDGEERRQKERERLEKEKADRRDKEQANPKDPMATPMTTSPDPGSPLPEPEAPGTAPKD